MSLVRAVGQPWRPNFRHPSSWSNRDQRDHAEATGRCRWETSDPELALRIAATVQAVAETMRHLDPDDILDPPHSWFDAALARQIVVWVLIDEFDLPRRVIAAVSLMSREAIARGCRTVEARRASEPFNATLMRIRLRARALLAE